MSKEKVAALQLKPKIGDLEANLKACERLAIEAGEKGAKWIILPEFFTTGMAFEPKIVDAIQRKDGPALQLLKDIAKKYDAYVGGSFLLRDEDGEVRNAFFLCNKDGVIGRHNKDLPTMWENCFYVGGHDDGLITVDNQTIGVSLCWEFMRSQTAHRLRNRVDLIVGGSCWWSIPAWFPKTVTNRWERQNEATALASVHTFAPYVGAPIIHASHIGQLQSKLPWMPISYKGHYEGATMIVDAKGNVIAKRTRQEGEGIVTAYINIGRTEPEKEIPDSYWLHSRGPLPALSWTYQRWHGQRWYRNNVAQ